MPMMPATRPSAYSRRTTAAAPAAIACHCLSAIAIRAQRREVAASGARNFVGFDVDRKQIGAAQHAGVDGQYVCRLG